MATHDELAARYPDLLGGAPEVDRELIETVRALDALYAAQAPARLDTPIVWPAGQQAATTHAGVTGMALHPVRPIEPIRREADDMRMLRKADGKRWTGIIAAVAACLVVGLLAALLIGGRGGFGGNSPGSSSTQRSLLIRAQTSCASTDNAASCPLTAVIPEEENIITSRLAYVLGVTNATITLGAFNELDIEIPGVTGLGAVSPLLSQGNITILDTGSTQVPPGTWLLPTGAHYPVVFTGTQVDSTTVNFATDPQTGQKVVTFAFISSAQQAFAQYTAQHIGQYLTIALDGVVIESATIQSNFDGTVQLTGLSQAQARLVAAMLKYGPLPVAFQILLVQGPCPPEGPITPAPTATEPPNAPTPLPTYTPWPSSTPIGAPTATPFPPLKPGDLVGPYPPAVIYECGTATPGPIGTAFPAATPPPNSIPAPTPAQGATSTPTPLPIPPTPTPIPTATPA